METQIQIITKEQDARFNTFLLKVVERFEPKEIFCFSKTAVITRRRGHLKRGKQSLQYHYCLLIVTESFERRLGSQIQDFANFHFQTGSVDVICHSAMTVSQEIKNNNRFFITVYRSADLLYSFNSATERRVVQDYDNSSLVCDASIHYNHRIKLATGFLNSAKGCLANGDYTICTFLIHQCIEQAAIGLIKVHLGYKTDLHNIHTLISLCQSFSDRPYKLFLSNKCKHMLFEILVKSYSKGRYDRNFTVLKEQAEILYNLTCEFLDIVTEMCEDKIITLTEEPTLHIKN